MYKPKVNQNYWMINSRFEVKQTINTGKQKSLKRIEVGNAFETREQAQAFRHMVYKAARGEFEGFRRTPTAVRFMAKVIEILLYILVLAFIVALIASLIYFVVWLRG